MLGSIFTENGIQLTLSGKIIKGKKRIIEVQNGAMKGVDPGVKVTITTTNIWLDGEVAYETGKYKYEYKEKGKPANDQGRYMTMWKRQKNGDWKLCIDMAVSKD